MRRAAYGLWVAAAILIVASTLGQTPDKAQLSGILRDESGGVVPGVELLLQGEETGLQRRTTSSETGAYLFPFLPPGRYRLHAEFSGFAPLDIEDLRLSANQSLDLALTLEVVGVAEVLTVSADSNAIETTSSTVRYMLGEEEIGELPVITDITINGGDRNVTALTALAPGAAFLPSNSAFQSSARVEQVSINGTCHR